MRLLISITGAFFWFAAATVVAQEVSQKASQETTGDITQATAQPVTSHVLLVSGIAGNETYEERFSSIADSISENFGPGNQWQGARFSLTRLAGANSQRQSILQALERIALESSEGDSFTLLLLGHGTYDGEHFRFNIPGPDLTGEDLKKALDSVPVDEQLIVLATSASGVMLQQLEKAGRTVITATKSGSELNAVMFPRFWAEALTTEKADYDRNEIVTVDEAFQYASDAVETHYTEQNLLATEHARMNGENKGQRPLALIGSLRNSGDDPVVVKLLQGRLELEQELGILRERKAAMTVNDYYAELQTLMLRMARLQLDIDKQTGWSEPGG